MQTSWLRRNLGLHPVGDLGSSIEVEGTAPSVVIMASTKALGIRLMSKHNERLSLVHSVGRGYDGEDSLARIFEVSPVPVRDGKAESCTALQLLERKITLQMNRTFFCCAALANTNAFLILRVLSFHISSGVSLCFRPETLYNRNGAAMPAATRRFWTSTGPFVAAANPDELADAALPDELLDAVLLAPLEVADEEEEVVLKLLSVVTVAVKPVTLVQLELTVLFTPVTKLTAAH